MKIAQRIGVIGFYLAWPAFYIYFRRSTRTRIVVVWEGQVLAMKNWVSDGRWSFPGGGLHKGEDPQVGAARELLEETGIQAAPDTLEHLGNGQYRYHGVSYPFQSFMVKLDREPVLHRQRIEVSRLCWMKAGELLPEETSPDVLEALVFLESKHPGFLLQ